MSRSYQAAPAIRPPPRATCELKELATHGPAEDNFKKLMTVGGFPEPFLDGTSRFYGLWAKSHLDLIVRQDLIRTEVVRDIDGIELLIELLSTRVGSTVSYNSLREDLGRDDKTIKHWITLLENLFVVFRVPPYSQKVARALKKASKFYFYDIGRVQGDDSSRLENLVALSLRKELDFQEDTQGKRGELFFGQTKERREMDFIVTQKGQVRSLIEVKMSDGAVSPHFAFFAKYFPRAEKLQLVRNLDREYSSKEGVQVVALVPYLTRLDFS